MGSLMNKYSEDTEKIKLVAITSLISKNHRRGVFLVDEVGDTISNDEIRFLPHFKYKAKSEFEFSSSTDSRSGPTMAQLCEGVFPSQGCMV